MADRFDRGIWDMPSREFLTVGGISAGTFSAKIEELQRKIAAATERDLLRSFNPFAVGIGSTANQLVEATPTRDLPTASVKDVHNEFNTASDKLLSDAQAVLAKAEIEDAEELDKLADLGFYNARGVQEALTDRDARRNAEIMAERVCHYRENYPDCKFITESQVRAICKSYGLIRGKVSEFIGDIPKENRQAILRFVCNDEDKMSSYGESQSPSEAFQVVGTSDQFNAKRKVVGADFVLRDEDPIVLYAVKGGFLVVTAWGDEREAVL